MGLACLSLNWFVKVGMRVCFHVVMSFIILLGYGVEMSDLLHEVDIADQVLWPCQVFNLTTNQTTLLPLDFPKL